MSDSTEARLKRAVQYVADFETAVVKRARRHEVEGVVCGHIHVPELRPIGGVTYANTGDWVENCTALVEYPDGRLDLRRWTPAPSTNASSFPASPTLGDGIPAQKEKVPGPSSVTTT